MNEPKLISKPEVIDKVGVSYPTLWDWMRKGKFPRSRQLGGKVCGWSPRSTSGFLVDRSNR